MKKFMHKSLSFILVLTLVLSLFSGLSFSSAADLPVVGICGNDLTYTFDNITGQLTIYGVGDMTDYCSSGSDSPFFNQTKIKKVIIGNSVTSICREAFSRCYRLTSVTIGSSVTNIGRDAFSFCSGLTSVTIPNSVTNIGMDAFSGCSGLTSITIPGSVTSIGASAFSGCSGLTSVTIPDSVTKIVGSAFSGCSGLTSITVANNNKKYDSRDNCNAIIGTDTNTLIDGCKKTVIPDSVTSIGTSAFSGCSGLTGIIIPNSVTSIGSSAFSGCSGLTSVSIPDSVTIIGMYAFSGCSSLTNITIPDSVTNIGMDAFSGCSGLKTAGPIGSDCNFEFGWTLTIPSYAFYGCRSLTGITIPNSVTSIGRYAFYGCSGLTSIDIKGDNCSIYDYAETLPGNATIIINGSKNVYNYAVKYNRNYICNHVEVIDEAKESTCLENGLTQGRHCDICSKVIQDQETTSALGHDYQKTAVVAPTCSEQGYTLYTCSRCSDSYKLDYANPLGHIEKEMITEPTCTSAGLKNIVCERCQQVLKTDVNTSALGHDYQKTAVVAPTCLERGYTTYTCSRCSDSYNADYKNALGHIEKEVITKSPTCTERGSKDIVCERCEQTVRGNISIPALKHNYNATVTSPTCTEEGYTTYTCTRCSDYYQTNYTYAWGHIEKDQIIRSSTCTELGSKNVFCERCQQIVKKGVPIPALGHDYRLFITEPTCINEGYTTYVCNRCESLYNSNYVSSLGHNDSAKTVVKPTETQLGYTEHSCSRCGELQRVDTFTAPTGKLTLKCKARTKQAQTVTWNNVKTATGYQVQISTKDGKKWSTYATLKAGVTAYTFKNLANGNNYKFRVRFYIKAADGKNYYSPWSSTLNSPTLPNGTVITKLTAGSKAFTAQWKKAGYTGYQIQYATNSKFSKAKTVTVKNAKTLKATVKKLSAKKVYYVRIRTYKTIAKVNYFSAWSKVVKVKTK